MKKILIPSMMGIALIASPAFASDKHDDDHHHRDRYYSAQGGLCGNAARDQWMTNDAAKAKATELGYDVRYVSASHGCLKVHGIDKNGARAEFYMNPVSGEIIRPDVRSQK